MQTAWRPLAPVRRALALSTGLSAGISLLMLAVPLFALQVLEAAVPAGSVHMLVQVGAIAAAMLLLAAILDLCREVVLVRAGLWLDHYLGQEMVETSLALQLDRTTARHRRHELGKLRDALCEGRLTAATDLPWGVLACAAVVLLHPGLGILSVAAWGLVGLVATLLTVSAGRARQRARTHRHRVTAWCEDAATAVDAGLGPRFARGAMGRFDHVNRPHVSNAYVAGTRAAVLRTITRSAVVAGALALLAAGAVLAIDGAISAGAALAAALVTYRGLATLEQTAFCWPDISDARHAWKMISSEHEHDVSRRQLHDTARAGSSGTIALEAVSVTADGALAPALSSISLVIDRGAALGIIGPPRSGKSTLAAVIAGRIKPSSGRVRIAGFDSDAVRSANRGPAIGYVPDTPALMAGSVFDNITCFSPDGTRDKAELVARFGGVHEIIAALPNGYETDVGPGGCHLPLRARRAVALARALYDAPDLVVLDEPELGLDEADLQRLESLLGRLRETGVGIVMATREPRLLWQMHAVAVLDSGKLSEILPAHRLPPLSGAGQSTPLRRVA